MFSVVRLFVLLSSLFAGRQVSREFAQLLLAMRVGEKAIVANTHETVGQHMQRLQPLRPSAAFHSWLTPLYRKDWVVYAKPPWKGPEYALKYLARYTHRVAISNSRLQSIDNGQVAHHEATHEFGGRERQRALPVFVPVIFVAKRASDAILHCVTILALSNDGLIENQE